MTGTANLDDVFTVWWNENFDWPHTNNGLMEKHAKKAFTAGQAEYAALAAKLAEAEERVEELASACEVVSSEFEGDLWKACRRILQETDFDFDHHEGVQVSAFEDHMREVLATRDDVLEEAAKVARGQYVTHSRYDPESCFYGFDLSPDRSDWGRGVERGRELACAAIKSMKELTNENPAHT